MFDQYDIIVVGGGHAGCEAAHAAAKLGSRVLMVTMNLNGFGQMSCNPAMGGVAKGQLIREIDALGGKSGIVSDLSAIQFRMLNRSKGPAVWSPRTQNDRRLFSVYWKQILEQNPNIDFWQDMVVSLNVQNNSVTGVRTKTGFNIYGNAVILTNGTFLNGRIYIGDKQFEGGRMGDISTYGLTENLVKLGFDYGRMKTGTPARLDGRTINYGVLQEQKGDEIPEKFSFSDVTQPLKVQKSCYITYTSPEVHEILKTGFNKSPLFNKIIEGVGPRYCPSIEDKINRFSDRERHQLFIEPEGRDMVEMYLNGFSSSLPEEIQFAALRKIKGLENVKIFKPGYAIEYDFFPPIQLQNTLETKLIENLYFAGQINGTTGYEEAAAQGLIAGINAHLKLNKMNSFVLNRYEAFIGVLVDDLVTKGTEEPYRMFTSRAEYRMLLRQDNADIRLCEKGYEIGLAETESYNKIRKKNDDIKKLIKYIDEESIEIEQANFLLDELGNSRINQKTKLKALLLRPDVTIYKLAKYIQNLQNFIMQFPKETVEETEIQIKYGSYIEKEKEMAEKILRLEKIRLPDNIKYDSITALSAESREKLQKIKPKTIGQASRISGVSPADISVLIIYIGR